MTDQTERKASMIHMPTSCSLLQRSLWRWSLCGGCGLVLQVTSLQAADGSAAQSGHVSWMLVSTALVLFMTAPGLAMFYGGLVRRKNVLGVMMQCVFLMGLMSIVWVAWGYSLAFGEPSRPAVARFIGNGDYLFLRGIVMQSGELPSTRGLLVPDLLFMMFQGMFFIITPALICGAFAERMKFSAMVLFAIAWGTVVYCPVCHMVWGGGWLQFDGSDPSSSLWGGALDFAGGTVVHVTSGFSALVAAMMVGRRLGLGSDDMRPHNLTYTAIGAAMLWVGWFGFNAGSALSAGDLAINALVVTHLSASAGAVAWATMERVARGKASVLGAASGAVAGLVCITPAAGFVQPIPSLMMGAAAGLCGYLACGTVKSFLGYDDSLDAFGVHGVAGTLGAILTGVFATTQVNPDGANGLAYGGSWNLLFAQIAAVAVTATWAIVASFLLLKILDWSIGLRVTQDGELQGLDLSEHGEEGYIFR